MRRPLLLAFPLLLLAAACAENPVSRYFEWQRHAEVVEFAPEPLYCYKTLAQTDCYAQPLDRRESNRISNYYGPAPGRVVQVVPPPLPKDKMGPLTEHAPLMVPREKVESEPLTLTPRKPPAAVLDTPGD